MVTTPRRTPKQRDPVHTLRNDDSELIVYRENEEKTREGGSLEVFEQFEHIDSGAVAAISTLFQFRDQAVDLLNCKAAGRPVKFAGKGL